MKQFGFNKNSKLKNSIEISRLFKDGKFLFSDNFKLLWEILPNNGFLKIKIGISVPKRFFKSAVQRNKIKRKMRECIRINKNILEKSESNFSLNIFLIYKSNLEIEFTKTEKEIISLFENLQKKINLPL